MAKFQSLPRVLNIYDRAREKYLDGDDIRNFLEHPEPIFLAYTKNLD